MKIFSQPISKKSLLETLYEMVENYNEYYNREEKTEKEICDDPKWHKIRAFAKKVYDDLKDVKYIPNEKDFEFKGDK